MWQNVLIIVLVLILVAFTYYHYKTRRLGIQYVPQSMTQASLFREVNKLVDLTKPYYCGFAKEAIAEMKVNLESISEEEIRSMQCSDLTAMVSSDYADLNVPQEIKDQLNLISEKIIMINCVDGYPNKQKMLANINELYNAFCKGVETKEFDIFPEPVIVDAEPATV